MVTYRIVQSIEFKDRQVTGPMVDQIVGSSRRIGGTALKDVIIFCRGYNSGAAARAAQISKEQEIGVYFKVVEREE